MSSTLEGVRPETAQRLVAVAKKRGLSLDDLLSELISDTDMDPGDRPFYESATADEWSRELRMWSESHPRRKALADDSRESIYEGRGE